MKVTTIRHEGAERVAEFEPVSGRHYLLCDAKGAPLRDMQAAVERGRTGLHRGETPLEGDIEVLAPIARPRRNVICVGKNYHDHAHEFTRSGYDSSAAGAANAIPDFPIFFTKPPETVIGPGDAIRYPEGVSEQLDYEAELGVIIGTGGRAISKKDAMGHVFGYVALNDVTARDLQARHKQWFLGKSLDTFLPMGPWIATADEVDGASLNVRCWVNDELRQDGNTRDLIFDIPTLIESVSAGLTLYPGDIIATGTPAGVGIGFDPPRFLRRGDEVRISIDSLGELRNRVL